MDNKEYSQRANTSSGKSNNYWIGTKICDYDTPDKLQIAFEERPGIIAQHPTSYS